MLFLVWIAVLVAALALYFKRAYSKFSRHGVNGFRPIPPFGTITGVTLRREHFTDGVLRAYRAFPKERFIGQFEIVKPMVLVRDIDLIKKITVKDFEHFLDHRSLVNAEVDPFFGRNLFALKGDEWKDMRSTLSPAFTSSKIKQMVPFMTEVGDQMIQYLKHRIQTSEKGYIDIDSKDITTRYANDVIATCAFGLKVDSLMKRDNQFYQMGKAITTFKFIQMLQIFLFTSFPNITKKVKIPLIAKKIKLFFEDLVLSTMKDREIRNTIRPDMIHLLMEAKKGQLSHEVKPSDDDDAGFATVEESHVGQKKIDRVWSDTDLVAQAFLFFFAGFDTVSTAMAFLLYGLAINPEVQKRLAQEIKEHHEKNSGKIDYQLIQHMPYLDMVISETLRLWPPAHRLDRQCVKDYNMGKPNSNASKDFILRKGEGLSVPVWAIHRDPQYFPDPEKFDPERFADENKRKIQPFTYMPFGLGPRNCIGSRFALCEVKVMAYQLLLHMEVSPCEKTCIPLKLSAETFNLRIKGGHWVRLRERKTDMNSRV